MHGGSLDGLVVVIAFAIAMKAALLLGATVGLWKVARALRLPVDGQRVARALSWLLAPGLVAFVIGGVFGFLSDEDAAPYTLLYFASVGVATLMIGRAVVRKRKPTDL